MFRYTPGTYWANKCELGVRGGSEPEDAVAGAGPKPRKQRLDGEQREFRSIGELPIQVLGVVCAGSYPIALWMSGVAETGNVSPSPCLDRGNNERRR